MPGEMYAHLYYPSLCLANPQGSFLNPSLLPQSLTPSSTPGSFLIPSPLPQPQGLSSSPASFLFLASFLNPYAVPSSTSLPPSPSLLCPYQPPSSPFLLSPS